MKWYEPLVAREKESLAMELNRREFAIGVGLWASAMPLMSYARAWDDTTSWDPFVKEITDSKTYLRRKFRQDVTDPSTGVNDKQLDLLLQQIIAKGAKENESWRVTKAKCFREQIRQMAIDVSPLDWYPAFAVWNRAYRPFSHAFWRRVHKINQAAISPEIMKLWRDGEKAGVWRCWQDFDHSVPWWDDIVMLGFPGMRERAKHYAKPQDPYYESILMTADATIEGIERFIQQGEKRLEQNPTSSRLKKEVSALKQLRTGAPQTAYQLLLFIWLYFFYSEHLEAIQCRSLSNIDILITPYLRADISAGRTTVEEFREQFHHFLWQWGSICNYWNQPITIGGTNPDGTSAYNEVSKLILDIADDYAQTTPKFLTKVAENTPDWAMDKMLDMARRRRSISFNGEEPISRAARKWFNATDEECRKLQLWGCYEWAIHDSMNRTATGHINYLKPIELMLDDAGAGRLVAQTFDDFKAEYLTRLRKITKDCLRVSVALEGVLEQVNPSNLMTLATEYALKHHRDAFANGTRHGNTTAILATGLGTLVDALLAVKELVYEKKEFSLPELASIMKLNWQGHEPLRLRMLRSKRKWGNNDPEANLLGQEVAMTFTSEVNGKPNARGGIFEASGHSARMYLVLGSATGATPDGRKAGEELSKNLSPTMGADTEGATALVNTLSHINSEMFPGDSPLDIMLHPSVCAGDKGLLLMKTLVKQYHKNGGSVVQFTVFSAEELRDAQKHPERYEDLQVRVCGWNVRWNDLCRSEQDAYIRRAEAIMR